jgi:hypothetical protein
MCALGIERAWWHLHETITRKFQCATNEELLRDVLGRFAAEQFSPTDMNPSAPPPESGARVEWWSTFCLIPPAKRACPGNSRMAPHRRGPRNLPRFVEETSERQHSRRSISIGGSVSTHPQDFSLNEVQVLNLALEAAFELLYDFATPIWASGFS